MGKPMDKRTISKKEKFHINSVEIEGIVTKIWDRNRDVFARIAVYDEHAEIIDPASNGGLPKRRAHYVTLQLEGGKTSDGLPISLSVKDRLCSVLCVNR